MVPLKPPRSSPVRSKDSILPWLFCHGPIEAGSCLIAIKQFVQLPWLFCHGPIEACLQTHLYHWQRTTSMTILSWPHWSCTSITTVAIISGTSMTILSWPHWSVPRNAFSFLGLELPWLFCHGPIEALTPWSSSTITLTNFHDYFVMAPLKPVSIGVETLVWGYFHDYFVMAPLKPKNATR